MVAFAAWEMSPQRMCGSHGSYSQVSPDGQYRAVLYEYDCGATTDFGTNLAILAKQEFDPFSVTDNQHVFGADSNHQAVGVDVKGMLPVRVEWKDAFDLQVTVPRKARIFSQQKRSGPVFVEYLVAQ